MVNETRAGVTESVRPPSQKFRSYLPRPAKCYHGVPPKKLYEARANGGFLRETAQVIAASREPEAHAIVLHMAGQVRPAFIPRFQVELLTNCREDGILDHFVENLGRYLTGSINLYALARRMQEGP